MFDEFNTLLCASAAILADIKARLRINSWLLKANSTKRAARIVVLDGCSYPELRLFISL